MLQGCELGGGTEWAPVTFTSSLAHDCSPGFASDQLSIGLKMQSKAKFSVGVYRRWYWKLPNRGHRKGCQHTGVPMSSVLTHMGFGFDGLSFLIVVCGITVMSECPNVG